MIYFLISKRRNDMQLSFLIISQVYKSSRHSTVYISQEHYLVYLLGLYRNIFLHTPFIKKKIALINKASLYIFARKFFLKKNIKVMHSLIFFSLFFTSTCDVLLTFYRPVLFLQKSIIKNYINIKLYHVYMQKKSDFKAKFRDNFTF